MSAIANVSRKEGIEHTEDEIFKFCGLDVAKLSQLQIQNWITWLGVCEPRSISEKSGFDISWMSRRDMEYLRYNMRFYQAIKFFIP